MKKNILDYFKLLISVLTITACSSTKDVTIQTTRPADITFPPSIQTILIIDRTEYDSDAAAIIEGFLTGELLDEDNFGAQELINGIRTQMRYSSRFDVKLASERLKGNSLTSVFPEQLPWKIVSAFCEKYDAQLVVAIEIFDSDFIITDGVKKVKKKRKIEGKEREVEVNEYYAEGLANVTIGIRVYDPENNMIVDQEVINKTNTWDAKANSLQDALKHLIAKNDATGYLSKRVGTNYAYKIAPMPISITRSYESESDETPELALGARNAEVGKWKEAIEVWKSAVAKAPKEDAGYLTNNIAIGYEVLGDFDSALRWAEKSYVIYGNEDALDYVELLQARVEDEAQVRQQFE